MVEATYPGVRVRARVVGVFWVITGHGREAKMIGSGTKTVVACRS